MRVMRASPRHRARREAASDGARSGAGPARGFHLQRSARAERRAGSACRCGPARSVSSSGAIQSRSMDSSRVAPCVRVVPGGGHAQRIEHDQRSTPSAGARAQPGARVRRRRVRGRRPTPWRAPRERIRGPARASNGRRGAASGKRAAAPGPHAVHRQRAARLARFVDRVAVQHHLDLVQARVPGAAHPRRAAAADRSTARAPRRAARPSSAGTVSSTHVPAVRPQRRETSGRRREMRVQAATQRARPRLRRCRKSRRRPGRADRCRGADGTGSARSHAAPGDRGRRRVQEKGA